MFDGRAAAERRIRRIRRRAARKRERLAQVRRPEIDWSCLMRRIA